MKTKRIYYYVNGQLLRLIDRIDAAAFLWKYRHDRLQSGKPKTYEWLTTYNDHVKLETR